MFLTQLHLTNFRNYINQDVFFNNRINIFEGANGQGKTNLLEAIYYLAVSHSFRTIHDYELVYWNGSGFFLKGTLKKKNNIDTVQIGYQASTKNTKIKVNGSLMKRGDFIYQVPIVAFSPDDILIIKEGPAIRRRYINLEGSRLKPAYYHLLKDYHRVLQHRNRLLKENRFNSIDRSIFEPWDRALVLLGSKIIKQRIALLRALEKQAQDFFIQMTNHNEKLTLNYVSNIEFDKDSDGIEQAFSDHLKKGSTEEIRRGCTVFGPHLDDFTIMINDYDAKRYSSQGQQRTAALALRMAEVELFYLSSRERPIVLFDDVFSELDPKRREQLINFLLQREGQSFITTAVPIEDYDFQKEKVNIFFVDEGKVYDERARFGH
ncbi:MAG: DNA replication/repair protein RecF [Dethiobacter sp.]|nr:DNA replication/repair protein RecF [Dethiobacter sp.]